LGVEIALVYVILRRLIIFLRLKLLSLEEISVYIHISTIAGHSFI